MEFSKWSIRIKTKRNYFFDTNRLYSLNISSPVIKNEQILLELILGQTLSVEQDVIIADYYHDNTCWNSFKITIIFKFISFYHFKMISKLCVNILIN